MKEQIENAISFLKESDVDGCITGSCLLGYFPESTQDVDVFCYTEQSFIKMLYTLHFSKMFLIIEPIEQWKFKEYTEEKKSSIKKFGIVSIKFKYNMCVDVNIIYKSSASSIFSVLSSFDMNIICKGIDLKTKQELDLTGNPGKIVDWNRWNTKYYSPSVWEMSRLLRQFERCIKYHKRGYNTDKVVIKYQEIVQSLLEYKNIFKSGEVDEKIKNLKKEGKILLKIFDIWLKTHSLSKEEEETLYKVINKL